MGIEQKYEGGTNFGFDAEQQNKEHQEKSEMIDIGTMEVTAEGHIVTEMERSQKMQEELDAIEAKLLADTISVEEKAVLEARRTELTEALGLETV